MKVLIDAENMAFATGDEDYVLSYVDDRPYLLVARNDGVAMHVVGELFGEAARAVAHALVKAQQEVVEQETELVRLRAIAGEMASPNFGSKK